MIRWLATYCSSIPPVLIDGVMWVAIAECAFCQQYLGGDEASKYISPAAKFWILFGVGSGAVISGAIKMFRSQAYAQHVKQKETQFFNKPTP